MIFERPHFLSQEKKTHPDVGQDLVTYSDSEAFSPAKDL